MIGKSLGTFLGTRALAAKLIHVKRDLKFNPLPNKPIKHIKLRSAMNNPPPVNPMVGLAKFSGSKKANADSMLVNLKPDGRLVVMGYIQMMLKRNILWLHYKEKLSIGSHSMDYNILQITMLSKQHSWQDSERRRVLKMCSRS